MMIIMVTILLFMVHLYVLNVPQPCSIRVAFTWRNRFREARAHLESHGSKWGWVPTLCLLDFKALFFYRKAVFRMRLSFTM